MRFSIIIPMLLIISNLFAQNQTKKDSIAKQELKEVVIQNNKKSIEQKADRTIFSFSDQAHLNSGSLLEGLKKLPGLIVSDVAGMMYQGKQLEVYMDGRPTNMYSNELTSYLEGMPANAIEKIEIITQPGAEFPATSGGAIINIITSKNAKKYVSATYSNGYSFSKYTKSRHRFNNSILINAKNDWFGWQVQLGQNYNESFQKTIFKSTDLLLSDNYSDKKNKLYFIKTGLKFDIKNDRLLLNYDINTQANLADIAAFGYGFTANDNSKTNKLRNEVSVVYQKRFQNTAKKFDFSLDFNQNQIDFNLHPINQNAATLSNNSLQNYYQFKIDFTNEWHFLDKTKWSIGTLAERTDFETRNFDVVNLDYTRKTFSIYNELQSTYKSFDFIFGTRLESYEITGKTDTYTLNTFKRVRLFPNATIQYNLMKDIFINANYNQKISLPNTSALNPNNTNYQNPNVNFYGNPNLDPTLFDNYEIKLSAMEYFNIGYSWTNAQNQVISRIVSSNSSAANVSQNLPKMSIHHFTFGFPVPFMIFTKGIKKMLEYNFNPDEINFIYLYLENQKHIIEGLDSKGVTYFGFMAQIILPQKIKFTTNFNSSTTGGNYYYYQMNRPFYNQMDFTFSKKFLSNNLSASIVLNDVLNTNRQDLSGIGTPFTYQNKYDSRRIGFSINYKLPSKNKLAKEENILTKEQKEDKTLVK
ncbi:TonB-dependent receptor [Flavobacterium branchiophilum]|uniref:Outer membrane receptor protein involved in Fe transport n=1 Tax=Flavobacterium branchiophilum TaxID=55197 RepID=A0A543G2F1_9FLAO|nr:outer membrane beta-barrel family protein [Flavobacterium branchiophilum]OXA79246.1 TonB-dependent receptor [Flavobacterium branchiophilum] [Flavobacterium branchiophilum NBRC 15030 = ATCC 35035]TQM40261.1 outer membrane receptor protein involved in Fe transport [Flavobacterium branchiophilum]GEM53959.1 TonB-dependent receptor [Flavobacterium branchiophilum NBRC 15030 = ATCC 35035]